MNISLELIAIGGLAFLAMVNIWRRWRLEDRVEALTDSLNDVDSRVVALGRRVKDLEGRGNE